MYTQGMASIELGHESDDALRVRAAWLYHVGDLNQAETAERLGITRARANKLIAEARDLGLVTVTVNDAAASTLMQETAIAQRHGLVLCIVTPALGLGGGARDAASRESQGQIARRAVGIAAAGLLKGKLLSGRPLTVGIGWGRTMEQMALHLAGVRNPRARFVSLLGSLTRNSASNPFEVVQALAARTGAQGHFLPVPFVADSRSDRDVLMSQRVVIDALKLARQADLNIASLGELGAQSLVARQGMLSAAEIRAVRAVGGVADLLGRFFDDHGQVVDHTLNLRTCAPALAEIAHVPLVVLCAGVDKLRAVAALLKSGLIHGLIIDGDTADQLLDLDP